MTSHLLQLAALFQLPQALQQLLRSVLARVLALLEQHPCTSEQALLQATYSHRSPLMTGHDTMP